MDIAAGSELIGREDELVRLNGLVRSVVRGRGGLGWIQGEPGIGASDLADRVVAHALKSGCSVLRGAGDELAQAFPLRMMADTFAVSGYPADPTRAKIARLLRGETDSGAVDPVLAASERLLELVDRQCADGPVVLVTDDLHWADEPSLLLWNRLARAVNQIPLLLIGTCRPVPYRATVARLRELVLERRGEVVELGPLSDTEVHAVAARVLGAQPGPLLCDELARAGGNPLYVEELVGALLRDGLVDVTGGVAEFHGESGAVPDSLTVAIGRRLRFPTSGTADVLRIAALLGNDFDLDELAIGSGRSVAELSGVVEEAVLAGAVHATGSRLRFRHELIKQVLVEQASTATRIGLHRHLARELAAAGRGVDVVARHLLAAPHAADRWVAGWLAEVPETSLYAVPQVAAELLARAIRLVDVDDPFWAVLTGRAAQVSYWLGRDEQAGRFAEEVMRRSTDVMLGARMRLLRVRSSARAGRPEEALGVASFDDQVPLASRATLGAWTAINLALVGEVDKSSVAAGVALDDATRSGDPLATGYALHASTLTAAAPTALNSIDRALSGLGEDPESMDLRLMLTNNRLTYLALLGRWDEAETALPRALMLAERAGTFRAASLLGTAAEICYAHGTWDDALVHIGGIDPAFIGNRSNMNAAAIGTLIALHRGERDTAEELLGAAGESIAELARMPANWRLTTAWSLHAEVTGDLKLAVARLATLLDSVQAPGQRTRQEMMPYLVRLALSADDRDTAAAAVEVSRADADSAEQLDRTIAARCCRALLDDDTDGLLTAAEDYGRHGWPLQQALALEETAVRLAETGDATRARATFTNALRTYLSLGATWDMRRTEARLRPHGIRRGPRSLHRRATSGWESLTPAETRIAELVARGLSNPDIAAELYLSRRTVQTHVSNILSKLGLGSRVDIMRAATA